ncbi:hypothetical protein G3A_02710 [Bacillus sp. 17376]|uniref:Uncharacterized protein n=1 Tax=Mesobacillus boroniphilus JCM 21738 TaxID=1294265 RepID=W4RWP2_9BACI|nr:hypothetical protein G3A_02710 [Bacillus sp. 17376]GAE48298.1 hypothetical protein JCM21738_5392 [Mesobacillus boroniphilus JCM 21738]
MIYGIGSILGGENIEFIYLLLFIVQFSFTTTILFQILHRVKQVEKKDYHKE